jgi:hypothetical protein
MSQFIVYMFLIDILVNKPYFYKVTLVAYWLHHLPMVYRPVVGDIMVRTNKGSNPAAPIFFLFLITLFNKKGNIGLIPSFLLAN